MNPNKNRSQWSPRTRSQPDGEFIAYLVQRFPSLRTTFIRREVEALRKLGLPIKVFSMRPVDAAELRSEQEALSHIGQTEYLAGSPLTWSSIAANLLALLKQPRTTLNNLRLAFSDAGLPGLRWRVRLWLQIWRGAVVAQRIRQLGNCKHLHAQFADGAATTALVASELLDADFSFTSHTSYASPILKEKLAAAKLITSISEYDKRQLIELADRDIKDKIHILHCGIPLEQWEYKPRFSTSLPIRLLSVGALIEKKGHDQLIRACALLRKRNISFRCRIIGAGPLHARLEELIKELNLAADVELLGPRPQATVRQELARADAFVLACQQTADGDTDGIPVSLMEAMALGRPVISTRISGVPELIEDEQSGYLANPGSPDSLADAICRCVQSGNSRSTVLAAARSQIEQQFNQQTEAERLATLLLDHIQKVAAAA